MEIVYEDADLAVINKPAGMVIHIGAGVHQGTLVNALLHHFQSLSQSGGTDRPGIVHRLDKQTSGLLVVARNDFSHANLARQFQSRTVTKRYLALVHGRMKEPTGEIQSAIGRDRINRLRMSTRAAHARGPHAVRSGGNLCRLLATPAHDQDGPYPSDPGTPQFDQAPRGGRHPLWRTGSNPMFCRNTNPANSGTQLPALGVPAISSSANAWNR